MICPHCWFQFPIEDTLFIARHSKLLGDAVLGADQPRRFLPTRFSVSGNALDALEKACPDRACPRCHLRIPHSLYSEPSAFLSLVGAPGSGKTYFLTSMIWELRRILPAQFRLHLTDGDAELNQWFLENEETLFLAADPEAPTRLSKTEMQGNQYDAVTIDGMPSLLPRPLILKVSPQKGHPKERHGGLATNLILYDNAGEHFQPGMDNESNPGTQHLLRSEFVFFLFDPTRELRFSQAVIGRDETLDRARPIRQALLLTEVANRIVRYRNLGNSRTSEIPLIVIAGKFDLWRHELPDLDDQPLFWSDGIGLSGLDNELIVRTSSRIEDIFLRHCPEIVVAAKSMTSNVTYIPVSSLGHSPHLCEDGALSIRPSEIKPFWACVPMLYTLMLQGRIPVVREVPTSPSSSSSGGMPWHSS